MKGEAVDRRNDRGRLEIYLDIKDQLDLRYLMENDYNIVHGKEDACETTDQALSVCIQKFWEILGDLELFAKYNSAVVIRSESGKDEEFDWQRICDKDDYRQETNTEIWFSLQDFTILEACLRRVMMFVTNGRIPERDEMLRMALRFRAFVVCSFLEKSKKQLGINAPKGLSPIY
jgi:hypothetical protein